MKTVKFKFLVPVLAIAFAITTAFSTVDKQAVENASSIKGFIDAPSPCMVELICSPTGSVLCKNTQGQQAFGKFNTNDTTCPREVYKN